MFVAFRADASFRTGSGHVARCRRLAARLREVGHETLFLIRDPAEELHRTLAEEGCQVSPLACSSAEVVEAEDVEAARAALGGRRPDWLVVDHYALGRDWETHMRSAAARILAIDDLGRPHDCDLLLDQGWLGDATDAYPGVTGEKLLGPRFALLPSAFAELRRQPRWRDGRIARVLVFFGGADGTGQTLQVLNAIDDAAFAGLRFDVVVGANNVRAEEIRRRAAPLPNVHLTAPLETLAGMMSEADLFVGAGGGTTWERCCVGLPAIVCWTAENQKAQTLAVADMGIQVQLGSGVDLTPLTWRAVLLSTLADPAPLQHGAGRGMALVDGRGAERVARRLDTPALTLRPACADDEAILLEWANDPDMRNNSFSRATITPDQHHAWFMRKLGDPDTYIWIGCAGGEEVGQVRFDCHGGKAMVDISISRQCRGRGYGVALLGNAMRKFHAAGRREVIEAEVLEANQASHRLFIAAGFECVSDRADERGSFRYTLKGGSK